MPRASIDIGSNSLLLTVMGDDGAVLHDEARVVGLGTGLGDKGMFLPERMALAEQTLAEYAATASQLGVEPRAILAVATSAARRAMNAETFFARVARKHEIRIRIIDGEEEARLSWLGTQEHLALPAGPCLVVDLGGGSTELVNGRAKTVFSRVSLEIGSVRLTEALLADPVTPEALTRARNHIEIELGRVNLLQPPLAVIGVAGTVTTLSAMALGLDTWDAERVQGSTLSADALRVFISLLAQATPAGREQLAAVSPQRAPYLLAGALILERVLDRVELPEMLVSARGLRFGLLV